MNILVLAPTTYELKLLPPIIKYTKYNELLYEFYFPNNISTLVGVTGIGKQNINRFFDKIYNNNFDIIISIGTCGFCSKNTKNIKLGDCFISHTLIYKNINHPLNIDFLSNVYLDRDLIHLGKSLTTDTYLTQNISAEISVDMEAFHIYNRTQTKRFLNLRIISDFCSSLEHTDTLECTEIKLENYRKNFLKIIYHLRSNEK